MVAKHRIRESERCSVCGGTGWMEVFQPRNVTNKVARKEVLDCVRKHSPIDPFDVSGKLNLDLGQVMTVGRKLEAEGKIGQ